MLPELDEDGAEDDDEDEDDDDEEEDEGELPRPQQPVNSAAASTNTSAKAKPCLPKNDNSLSSAQLCAEACKSPSGRQKQRAGRLCTKGEARFVIDSVTRAARSDTSFNRGK